MPDEIEIQMKMEAGLTREQAIEVIERQASAGPAKHESPEAVPRKPEPRKRKPGTNSARRGEK